MRLYSSSCVLTGLALTALLSSCVGGGRTVNRQDMQSSWQIEYGVIESVQQVQLQSNVGAGAILGGIIGLASSRRHAVRNAAVGAAAGALITAAAEGDNTAFEYIVTLASGETVRVVIDHGDMQPGDCAALERGPDSNLRHVAPTYCDFSAPYVIVDDPDIHEDAHEQADDCQRAKERLLEAETDEELARARRKVEILCHH